MSIEPDDVQAKDSQAHDAEPNAPQPQSVSEPEAAPAAATAPDAAAPAAASAQYSQPAAGMPGVGAPAGAPADALANLPAETHANAPAAMPNPGAFAPSYAMPTAFPPEPSIEQPWYGVSFGDAIERAFHKYFVFQGRASRGEFWWFYLASFVAGLVVGWIPLLGWVAQLFVSLPLLSLGWRRMHDTGKPGWWSLVLPLAGGLVTVIGIVMSIALGDRDMWGDIVGPSWPMFSGSILLGIACFGFWVYLLAKPSDVRPNRYDLPLGAPVSGAFATNQPAMPSGGYALGTPAPTPAGFQPAGQATYPAAGQAPAGYAAPGYGALGYPTGFGATQPAAPSVSPAASGLANPASGPEAAVGERQATVSTPEASSAPADPVLAELSNAATAPARLQEIAAIVPTHPEYKAGLLAHPNLYPALRTWLEQL